MVSNGIEQTHQVEEENTQHSVLQGELETRLDLELTSMESQPLITVVPSYDSHTETLRRLTEAQTHSGVQQSDKKIIADKLKDLPGLIRVNQENKALKLKCEKLESRCDAVVEQLSKTTSRFNDSKELNKEQQLDIEELEVENSELKKQLRAKYSVNNKENTPSPTSFLTRNS